jgi:hypothetical protein
MKTTYLLRTLALSLVIIAGVMAVANARELTVAWDANPEPDIAGYVLTVTTGKFSREIDLKGKTEVNVDLQPGDVLFVRAYNTQGTHGPNSDPLTVSQAPGKPGGLRVTHTVTLEQSNNLGEWEKLATISTYDSAQSQAFWRVANP